jgi:hypothetical protein
MTVVVITRTADCRQRVPACSVVQAARPKEERMIRKAHLAAPLAVLALVPAASAAPVADLQLVSMTANVKHARVGDPVTWTMVARKNGPDAVDLT